MKIEKNKPGNTIELPWGRLINNTWGAPPEDTLQSSIFEDEDGSIGWYWNRPTPRPRPGHGSVEPIYPCLRIGGSPLETSKSPLFPFRWSDCDSLKLELTYEYTQPPIGSYDLAYDIFFTNASLPGQNVLRKAEVMIWINATQKQPPSSYKGDFSDGANTYTLYSRMLSDGQLYGAFIMKEGDQSGHHTVNAKALMDNLALESEWYVPGIDLGNEVWVGSGRIEVKQIAAVVNGKHV